MFQACNKCNWKGVTVSHMTCGHQSHKPNYRRGIRTGAWQECACLLCACCCNKSQQTWCFCLDVCTFPLHRSMGLLWGFWEWLGQTPRLV
jgi:hypothetical protein